MATYFAFFATYFGQKCYIKITYFAQKDYMKIRCLVMNYTVLYVSCALDRYTLFKRDNSKKASENSTVK